MEECEKQHGRNGSINFDVKMVKEKSEDRDLTRKKRRRRRN